MVQLYFELQGLSPVPQDRKSMSGSLSDTFLLLVAVFGGGVPTVTVSVCPAVLVFVCVIFLSLIVWKVLTSVSVLLQGEMFCV